MNPRPKTRILVPLGQIRPPSTASRVVIVLLRFVVAPLFVLFRPFGRLIELCFRPLNHSAARKCEREFAIEIKNRFTFLFKEHGGTIVLNDADVPLIPSFDGAYVTVATDDVRFRFTRGRGDFLLEVAPLSAPTEWERLDLVLAVIPNLPVAVEGRDTEVLRTVARVLPILYKPLCEALQKERASETLNAATRTHNERTEEYIQQLKQNGVVPRILKPK